MAKVLDKQTFSELVRELRKAQDVSQAEIARRAGISAGYIGLIETGDRGERPSLEVVKKIAQALRATDAETEALLRSTGHLDEGETLIPSGQATVPDAVRRDRRLTKDQKQLIIAVYEQLVRVG